MSHRVSKYNAALLISLSISTDIRLDEREKAKPNPIRAQQVIIFNFNFS